MNSQGNSSSPALQALTSRVDLLEKSLETECTSRQQEGSDQLATFHELVTGGRRRQEDALQELEKRIQVQLEAAKAEVQQLQQELSDERRERQSALHDEKKEREENDLVILKTVDSKLTTAHEVMEEKIEEKIASVQLSAPDTSQELEKQLQSSVASFVERSSKELMTTRQDLLELREELQEVSRAGKENLEMAISRLSSANLPPVGKSDRPEVGDVHRLIDGQTKLREELWNDVDRVRNELRMETASRKEDVQGVRSSVDRLREQVALHPGASGNGTNSSSPLLATDDVRAALAAERMAREQGDERCLEEMRDMVREERQKREKEYGTLELRMQSEEQTLFVESGKREERDRNILSQISTVSEEMDAVKRLVASTSQQRQQVEDLQKSQAAMKLRLAQVAEVAQSSPSLGSGQTGRNGQGAGSASATIPCLLSPHSTSQPCGHICGR